MKYRVLHFLLVVCLLLCSIVPSAFAVDGGTITRLDIKGAEYFHISELEGLSDITVTEQNDTICLAEDGLEVCLSANSRYVFRNGCVVAVLNTEPVFLNGEWYISVDFYDDFLCKTMLKNLLCFMVRCILLPRFWLRFMAQEMMCSRKNF